MVGHLSDFDADEIRLSEPGDGTGQERSFARRIALQVLYEVDCTGHRSEEVIANHLQIHQPSNKAARYIRRLVQGVLNHRQRVDRVIEHYAPEWPLDQLAIVDRNILRLGIYELGIDVNAPVAVVIDEAVMLADMFGAEGSPRFINGVLGAIADDMEMLGKLLNLDGEEGET
jgi:N utilization substance protein B